MNTRKKRWNPMNHTSSSEGEQGARRMKKIEGKTGAQVKKEKRIEAVRRW
jgi:hypothetical protein